MADRSAWKIASEGGRWSLIGKKRGKGTKPGPAVHDDLLAVEDAHGVINHRFTGGGPNQVWLTDIEEHRTGDGTLYLCAVKDAYSGRIVGYSIDTRVKSTLAVAALRSAVARRGPVAGCIVHSDRGSQFRSRKYLRELRFHRLRGSMRRVAAAGDNAAMESFFALLQNNVLNRRSWTTRDQLRIAIVTWIVRTYHRRRCQARLNHDHASHTGRVTNHCHLSVQQFRFVPGHDDRARANLAGAGAPEYPFDRTTCEALTD